MDPIGSFSGLASGFQWRDMVDQMMQMEIKRRFTPVQNQVNAATKRRDAWNSFSGLLSKFSASAQALRDGSSFGVSKASLLNGPAGTTLLSATTSATATPGSYQIKVVDLARADKLAGKAFDSSSEALGITGDFFVNGKRIEVAATDTLATVRNAINASNAGTSPSGVTATILSTSSTEHRLVLTSDATGTRGIELTDGDAGVLQSLGVTSGVMEQNTTVTEPGKTQSQRFSSSSASLASMLGITAPPAETTINIGGQEIAVNLETDTLISIMNKLAAGTASVEEEKVGSTTMHRLSVDGPVTAAGADLPLSQRVIELLGFQKGERASPITEGQDAKIEVDGFEVTRRTNVVSDVIGGVTLNLQTADAASTVDLVVSRDLGAVTKAAEDMAAAYNELVKFADAQRGPDAPLASNGSLRATMRSLTRSLLDGVSTLPDGNPYTHASLAGIELTKEGTLKVDSAKLKSALETNFADVQALLTTSGTTTDPEVTYLLGGKATQPDAYAVDITTAALQASAIGSAWGDPTAYGATETLSITDSSSGKTLDYDFAPDTSLTVAVTELNALFAENNVRLTAIDEGGALRITAKDYGSNVSVTFAGAAATTLGLAGTVSGTDVAGTIGGHAATGRGQTLTGADNTPIEGLAIRYSGTTARAAGNVSFTLGVGGILDRVVAPAIRSNDGIIASQVTSINRSIENMNKRLDDIESRLEIKRQSLIGQFSRMEGAMSLLQSQSNWLGSQIQSMNGGGQQ